MMLARLPANMRDLALERARPHLGFEPAKIVSEVLVTDTDRGPVIVRVPDPPPAPDPDHPLGLVIHEEMTIEEFRKRYPDHSANLGIQVTDTQDIEWSPEDQERILGCSNMEHEEPIGTASGD
jgi:hypothetical protein